MAISGYIRVRAGGFPIEMLDAIGLPTAGATLRLVGGYRQMGSCHGALRADAALILAHIAAGLNHLRKRDGVFDRISGHPFGRGRA